ncbi:MAG TPA: MaoC family dehydratase [Bacillota bacterium]|nr:MaoC family dehydratase [Bacillota bacterium]
MLQRYFPRTINIQITEQLIQQYATVSEDWNPLHHSNHAAKRAGFPKRIAHGMLTMAISTQLITPILLQQNKVERFQVKFLLPVYINDCLTITSHLQRQSDGNTFHIQIKALNQHAKTVMNGKMKIAPLFTNP